jgi:aspartokinase/homoserine dehydrogenase 1
MIAKLENGKATISLEEVNKLSPFYFLSGSDNMIVFTTERYKDRPLVIQGPGAGAEVTAAGVFAEIIHIGNLL